MNCITAVSENRRRKPLRAPIIGDHLELKREHPHVRSQQREKHGAAKAHFMSRTTLRAKSEPA
jgi:hypothetical protein